MTEAFNIWIYSTDTYTEPGTDSEILLSAMPAEAQVVAGPVWTRVQVVGLDWDEEDAAEPEERNGIMVHCRTKFIPGKLNCLPLGFPAERDDLTEIFALFRKNYIYICMDGDTSEGLYPWRFHDAGKCLMICLKDKGRTEHDYDYAAKKYVRAIQRFLPE